MSQTSYPTSLTSAFAGLLGDISDSVIDARRNAESSDVPFGIAVCADGTPTDDGFKLPASAGDVSKLLGVLVQTHARTSINATLGPQAGAMADVMARGRVWVNVEQAVALTDTPCVRFSANGTGKTQLGAFRKDADGVAEVHTITPTAADSTVYTLRVSVPNQGSWTFHYTSDASATATEIVTGFKTVMAADAAFTALVVATGTSTLILTAQTAGVAFTCNSEGDGALADSTTTPAAAHAKACKGARFLTSTSGSGLALLEFDANVSRMS